MCVVQIYEKQKKGEERAKAQEKKEETRKQNINS